MRPKLIALLIGFLLILPTPAQGQDTVTDLFGRINNLRTQLGLPGYTLNRALSVAAQNQAEWMVETGQIAHSHPDGNSVRDRARAAGYGSTWVSENIYMGTIATVDDAWQFWMNSSIHYRGITNSNYYDVGVGAASGEHGHAFVLVFGNPGGITSQSSPRNTANGDTSEPAAPEQPPYVVGLDQFGNIMHEIQPGDTLGGIALIYGYTWDDLPYIRELNNLAEGDERTLEIGAILLIPPKDGTYTPTPSDDIPPTPAVQFPATFTEIPESTEPVSSAALPSAPATLLATSGASPPPDTPLPPMTGQISAPVSPTAPPAVADWNAPADGLVEPAAIEIVVVEKEKTSPLLYVAIGLQVVLLVVAGVEFWRRGKS